jgi:hypothetical protein
MPNIIFNNFVLENEIESQFNSQLDLMYYCNVDNSLVGTAGDIRKIRRYSATDGAQDLEMGEGNTVDVSVNYTELDYRILLTQGRFPYYDEEQMRDPFAVEAGIGHLAINMFNETNKKIMTEYSKTPLSFSTTSFDFNAFVNALALLKLPEGNAQGMGAGLFAFVNPKQSAAIRIALASQLSYVESFVRSGYVGTVAGVSIYNKDDAPDNYIVLAHKNAVTYFVKKGTEVGQERDENIRKNTIYARKYYLPALTNEKLAVRIVLGSNTAPVIVVKSLANATVGTAYSVSVATGATGTATITYSIERGKLPAGLSISDAGAITGTPTTAGTYKFIVLATNAYGASSKELSINVVPASA